MDRYQIAILIFFAILSITFTRDILASGGHYYYIDRSEKIDLGTFRADFLSIWKSAQGIDLDSTKRIVFDWIFLFIDEQQFDTVRFTGLAFFSMAIAYAVFLKLMENEKAGLSGLQKHAAAFVGGFFYFVNPLSLEHFGALYPEVSYALFPAVFYFMYMCLRTGKMRYRLLFGGLSAFLFLLVIHNALYVSVAAAATAFVLLFAGNLRPVEAVKRLAVPLLVFFSLTLFAFVPFLHMWMDANPPLAGYDNPRDYVMKVNQNAHLLNILILDVNLHHYNLLGQYAYPEGNGAYAVATTILVAAVVAGALYWRNILSLVAATNFVVFSFLANGINSPAGGLYEWIIFNAPFGWLIRASPKFTAMLPFFFAILIVCFVSELALRSRKGFWLVSLLVIANQSIFCWPVWTGDFAGHIEKFPAPQEMLDIIGILKGDGDGLGKTAWYGDFVGSAPGEVLVPHGGSLVALRHLIENENPSEAFARMSRALEIRYVMIDKEPARHWFDFSYAKDAVPGMQERFRRVYDGAGFKLYEVNDEFEAAYIPQAVFLVYGGYDAALIISGLQSGGREMAFIIVDDGMETAQKAFKHSDIMVFGPGYAPIFITPRETITFPESGLCNNPYEGWAARKTNADAWEETWLREMRARGVTIDQEDFGAGLAYTEVTAIPFRIDMDPPVLFAEGMENTTVYETRGYLLYTTGSAPVQSSGWFHLSCHLQPENVTVNWIDADFFGGEGEYLGSKNLFDGGVLHSGLELNFTAPEEAKRIGISMLVEKPSGDDRPVIDRMAVYSLETRPNILSVPFKVEEDGEYEVFLRVYRSRIGGSMAVNLNERTKILNTSSFADGFEWLEAYEGPLSAGENRIEITNLRGANTVNLAYYQKTGGQAADVGGKGLVYFYEAEEELETNASILHGNYSNGQAILLGDAARAEVYIHDNRTYHAAWEGEGIEMAIDGKTVTSDGILLGDGWHHLEARPVSGQGMLDYILIYDAKAREVLEGLEKNLTERKGSVVYEKIGKTAYRMQANTSGPALLVLTEGYDRCFKAYVNGRLAEPIPVYSTILGFPIEKAGEYSIEIRCETQDWFERGLLVSGLSAILICAYLATRWKDA